MKADELTVSIVEAKQNEWIRERMIRRYKPYILNTVGHICKKFVTWSDEETSIGLISFNRAIDTYDANGGRTFRNYVYLLIKRDLIDYFRSEKNEKHLSFEYPVDEQSDNLYDAKRSIETFERTLQMDNLVEEILELNVQLSPFRISFEELEAYCPKHQDTRAMLMKMASDFTKDNECVSELLEKKKFPMTTFTKKTSYRSKTIERHRKYLITLIILHLHPEWVQLSQYIKEPPGGEER